MTPHRGRVFSDSERVALYLASGGRCANPDCAALLEPGWHADHVHPFSAGGVTDVTNGQALCPTCNLSKGAQMTPPRPATGLRPWQQEALEAYRSHPGADFLAVACPGAGKTRFALTVATDLLAAGPIDRIIVVAPTTHLRGQWKDDAHNQDVELDNTFENGAGALAGGFHGTVVTYAAVARSPLLWRKLCADKRTLVILDEVHHASEPEHTNWGPALKEAFEPAVRRLLLSGTPLRTDRAPLPFVIYDERGLPVVGFSYGYGQALIDGGVVRPVEFLAHTGAMQWRTASTVCSAELHEVSDAELPAALKTALDPAGEWIPSVLQAADKELTRQREEVPDAGGLVIASNQVWARAYGKLLRHITGEEAAVAVSDDPDASHIIRRFGAKGNRQRWLVCVRMVSEGVDIPRLAVGVYATNIRTDLFLKQAVGRFVRCRTPQDETTATLFIPSIAPLLRAAAKIEQTIDEALAVVAEQPGAKVREQDDVTDCGPSADLFEPLSSSEATLHQALSQGVLFSDDELREAETIRDQVSGARGLSPIAAAQFVRATAQAMRAAGADQPMPAAAPTFVRPAPPTSAPMADQRRALRTIHNKMVNRWANQDDLKHSSIHYELNERFGNTVKTASIAELEERIAYLRKQLDGPENYGLEGLL